jgi:hypothetical protein
MTSEEAFETWAESRDGSYINAAAAWQAALEWAAKGQEPVVWRCLDGEDHIYTDSKSYAEMFEHTPLYLHPAPIREGWKWVPIVPTNRMRVEGREMYCNDGDEKEIYQAMLDAAPEYKEGE